MPLYEYECLNCGKRTEVLQRFDDAPLAACPSCGGEVKKLISSPAFQFKGTGWYVTDYAGKKGPADKDSKSKSKSEGAGEAGDSAGKAEKVDKSEKSEKTEKPAASETKSSGGGSGAE
jgi:putative FmdB family regulatory protein